MWTTIERSWRLSPEVLGPELILAMRRKAERDSRRRAFFASLKLTWLRFVNGICA